MSQVWQNASGIQWGENSKDPTTLCRNELTAAMHAFNRASNEEFADRSLILGLSSVRLTLANPICYMSRYISSFYWSLKNAKSNEPCWIRTSAPCLKVLTKLKPDNGFSELHLAESRKVRQEIPTSAPWAHLFTPGQSRQARSNVHNLSFDTLSSTQASKKLA